MKKLDLRFNLAETQFQQQFESSRKYFKKRFRVEENHRRTAEEYRDQIFYESLELLRADSQQIDKLFTTRVDTLELAHDRSLTLLEEYLLEVISTMTEIFGESRMVAHRLFAESIRKDSENRQPSPSTPHEDSGVAPCIPPRTTSPLSVEDFDLAPCVPAIHYARPYVGESTFVSTHLLEFTKIPLKRCLESIDATPWPKLSPDG